MCSQVPLAEQPSSVQLLPSSHWVAEVQQPAMGVVTQTPPRPEQRSCVQAFPSLHSASPLQQPARGALRQVPLGRSHTFEVQASVSAHWASEVQHPAMGVVTHTLPATGQEATAHTLPPEQSATVRQQAAITWCEQVPPGPEQTSTVQGSASAHCALVVQQSPLAMQASPICEQPVPVGPGEQVPSSPEVSQ